MKIISIAFKNINCLKGEHRVDFDKEPLASSGIFAITGPTGSGKSTLLDVMTLALFNQIPRLGKISKKGISDNGSVVTHNTNEAYAVIVYAIKDKRYTSSWKIAKNRNGSFNDYEMTLFNGEIPFDLLKSKIPAKNEELIGLTYDQFVKSIILSQGEFAKFLRANKNERGQLLENITGTSIYRKLGKLTFETFKEHSDLLKINKLEWEAIKTLDIEEKKELQSVRKSLKKEESAMEKEVRKLQKNQIIKKSVKDNGIQLDKTKQKQKQLLKDKSEFQPKLEKLNLHNKLSPMAVDFSNYNQSKKAIITAEENIENYRNKEEKVCDDLEKILKRAAELTSYEIDAENIIDQLNTFDKIVSAKDAELNKLQDNGKTERERVNARKNDLNNTLRDKIDDNIVPVEAIKILAEHKEDLKQKLEAAGFVEQNYSELEKHRNSLFEERRMSEFINSYSQLLLNIENLEKEIENIHIEIGNKEKELHLQDPLYDEKNKLIEALNNQLKLLQEKKLDAIKIAKYEDLRHELVDGEECPLCGALEHPFTVHLPENEKNEIDVKIRETEISLAHENAAEKFLRDQITKLKGSISFLQKNIGSNKSRLSEQQKTLRARKEQYSGKQPLPVAYDELLIIQLNKKLHQKEIAVTSLSELKINKDIIRDYRSLGDLFNDYSALKIKRNAIYTGKSIKDDCQELQKQFNDKNKNLATLKAAADKEKEIRNEQQKLFRKLSKSLLKEVKQSGLKNVEELNICLLDPQEFGKITIKKDELIVLETEFATKINSLTKAIDKAKAKDEYQELNTEQINKLTEDSTAKLKEIRTGKIGIEANLKNDLQRCERIGKMKEESKELSAKVEKWKKLNSLIGDSTGNNFANFAQGLTLQNLLVYANNRMKKLSDRYLILKPENDGPLRVVDQYQGNIVRSVTTLSGGETFLMSLALALSLSDMASRTVAIDCLFIDEGFSSLDQETQIEAMNTLDSLQSESQKTIGVISHVASLKERINVQIRLQKNAQGYSKLIL